MAAGAAAVLEDLAVGQAAVAVLVLETVLAVAMAWVLEAVVAREVAAMMMAIGEMQNSKVSHFIWNIRQTTGVPFLLH